MRTDSLRRIDSFPYRHRVAQLMSTPLVSALPEATVAEVSRLMSRRRISSVVAVDHQGRPSGILTERDILHIVATDSALLSRPFGEVMSRPVHTVGSGALAYRAIGRMSRHGVRHLAVVDDDGRAVGMLTAGALLKQRATLALTLGDEIEQATETDALREAHGKLSSLAAALRVEEVPAVQVSAVVSGIVCDLTARAAALAAASMPTPAPAPWCLLVLGSAGRGESLLAADQDNALIHEGDEHGPWFGTFADRLNEMLATAGIPLCAGGVMARNAAFRGTPATWRERVDQWVDKPQPDALLNVDIFYDFVPVAGERRLAAELRGHAMAAASRSPLFLRLLAETGGDASGAFGWFNRLRTENGRIDLKRHGLFPLVAGARVAALAWTIGAPGTDARLAGAAAKAGVAADMADDLAAARAVLVEAILDQQIADIAQGRSPSNHVELRRLGRRGAHRLAKALQTVTTISDFVQRTLSNRRPEQAA